MVLVIWMITQTLRITCVLSYTSGMKKRRTNEEINKGRLRKEITQDEGELAVLDTATVEAEWLRELLIDLSVVEKPIPTISMSFDNQKRIVLRIT